MPIADEPELSPSEALGGLMKDLTTPSRLRLSGGVLALVMSSLFLAPPGEAAPSVALPTCPTTTLTRTGTQTAGVNQANASNTWNLRGAVWQSSFDQGMHTYPVRSDAWDTGCILGSEIHGPIGRNETREMWFNGIGGDREGGEIWRPTFKAAVGNYLIQRDGYGSDFEDANDPQSTNASNTYTAQHQHLEWIRDDCVENEDSSGVGVPMNVNVEDSLWDGCFTVFAERPTYAGGAVKNGTGASTLRVEDSLIYSAPQPLGSTYCNSTKVTQGRCKTGGPNGSFLGSHGIWKWSEAASKTVIMNNVTFRLDLASYSSCSPQVWPDGQYTNVRLLWTGSQTYAKAGGCTNVLPPGVTLVTGQTAINEWNAKKAAWLT